MTKATGLTLRMCFSTLILCAFLILPFISGCGSKDADKIGDTQICLDNATAATANACLQKIDGLTSKAAYALRCAGGFITEGFDQPSKYIEAYKQLSTPPSGCSGTCSPTLGAMTLLTFSSMDNANSTYNNCYLSGSQGYTLLASTVKSATILARVANTILGFTGTLTAANLESAAAAIANGTAASVATPSDLGSVAITTYQLSCTTGNQNDNSQQLCKELSTAIDAGGGAGNPTGVGNSLLGTWQN